MDRVLTSYLMFFGKSGKSVSRDLVTLSRIVSQLSELLTYRLRVLIACIFRSLNPNHLATLEQTNAYTTRSPFRTRFRADIHFAPQPPLFSNNKNEAHAKERWRAAQPPWGCPWNPTLSDRRWGWTGLFSDGTPTPPQQPKPIRHLTR